MNIYKELKEIKDLKRPVITIGSFDGLHLGHKALIERIRQLAEAHQTDYALITFDPHPRQIVYPGDKGLKLLTTLQEKLFVFEHLKVSNLVIAPFSVEFSQISADEYIEKFLVGVFHPSIIAIGYDHRFGLNRTGDIHYLKWHAERLGYKVIEIDPEMIDSNTVSSTKIRKALEQGDISKANLMLGHHYLLHGKVVHGQKLGRHLGYPTANLLPGHERKLIPNAGIYAVFAHVDKMILPGVVYIGKKSTVAQNLPADSIELYCMDYEGDLYDKEITIEMVGYIREDQHFADTEQLTQQIAEDVLKAKNILSETSPSFPYV